MAPSALFNKPTEHPMSQPFDASKSLATKTMIVALARKLLIALWRLVTTGEVPEGVILRPAA